MDLSFSTSTGLPGEWSLDELAAWAAAHDFDAVRLRATGVAEPDVVRRDGHDRVRTVLSTHGLYLACLTAHCALLHPDSQMAEREQQRLLECIDAAAALGAPVIITNTGSPYSWQFYGTPSHRPGNPTDHSAECVALFKERFAPAVRRAEEKGIKIALDTAVRMGNIACNPDMWERCLDALPSDALGLSCDPSHLIWLHITPPEDAIRMFAGKWFYADVKDCEISPRMLFRQGIIGNWWWHYRVPGRGQINWGTMLGALAAARYDYVLCVENEDPDCPGLDGFDVGRRHLAQFLPRRERRPDRSSPPAAPISR